VVTLNAVSGSDLTATRSVNVGVRLSNPGGATSSAVGRASPTTPGSHSTNTSNNNNVNVQDYSRLFSCLSSPVLVRGCTGVE